MIAIQAIGPILLLIALMAPIITGYRREKLSTSIRIGWVLVIFAYFCADLIIPALALHFYGREAMGEITPETPATMAMMILGWIYPLVLHFVGFVLCEVVDVLRGLLSKARHR
jgi:hypothetical protein